MAKVKHLISLNNWDITQINALLDLAIDKIKNKSEPCNLRQSTSKPLTQINLFYENSTRTLTSFELAGKKLGLNVINVNVATSSVKKGESLRDTLLTLQAMQPDLLVMRHSESGAVNFAAEIMQCSVINAGDGMHEHPSQALLDAVTIKMAKGKIAGLNIAICGDILHSRVARSNIISLSKLGANLRLIAPSTLLPSYVNELQIPIYHNITEGIIDADIVMLLRLQKERMQDLLIPSYREYNHFYGLNEAKLKYAKQDCLIMHPGPINRNIEISSHLVESVNSLIIKQVETGIYTRMAIIETLLRS